MTFDPEVGLVIRYDFLRKVEEGPADTSGKDRPCAIILMSKPRADGSRLVAVCPVTHLPPDTANSGIEIPAKVARHLGLDDDRMWVKTDHLNQFEWEAGRLPFGVSPLPNGNWSYGFLPQALGKRMFNQVVENYRKGSTETVDRDTQTGGS